MTPDQSAALALAYVKAFTPVLMALGVALASVYAAVKTKLHGEQIQNNTKRLDSQSASIKTLMLNTAPVNPTTAAEEPASAAPNPAPEP